MRLVLLTSVTSLLLSIALALALPWSRTSSSEVRVDFLDVGQGDSILIQSPTGRRVLVDTGPDGDVLIGELSRVLPPFVRDVDLVILTHSDHDHIGGMEALLGRYHVGEIVHNREKEPKEGMEDILRLAAEQGIPVTRAHAEHDLRMESGVLMDFLTPLEGGGENSSNNQSLVTMLVVGQNRLLLTGDAETPVEHQLLREGKAIAATILKGGHHGSKSSTGEEFLSAVLPGLTIFQNSLNNSYGHPAKEVMERLAARKIPVYNTGIDGAVTLQCSADAPCRLTSPHRGSSP